MDPLPEVIYLHGLGSSPESDKARLITNYLQSLGYVTHTPNLSVPSLAKLSVNAAVLEVLRCVEAVTSPCGYLMIGSSFGGFLALQVLERCQKVGTRQAKGIVLLAPALYPWHPVHGMVTASMEEAWNREGVFPVQESASGRTVGVHVDFIRQIKLCSVDKVELECATLLIHGQYDEVVPIEQSFQFCASRPSVTMVTLPDTHRMLADPKRLLKIIEDFVVVCGKKGSTPFV